MKKTDLKRRLSSDGKTPKPDSKSVKMADKTKGGSKENTESTVSDRLLIIAEAVNKLQEGQHSLQSLLESKLDKFRNDFISSIDEKFKAMRSDIDLELSIHQNEIQSLSRSIESVVSRLEGLEKSPIVSQPSPLTGMINTGNPLEDPNRTIIATNVAYMGEREDLLEIAKDLVSKLELEEPVTVLAAARLKGRFGKPGLVKISFATLQEKILVLREKRKLREHDTYKSIFLRSSKSHTERLIELNARTLLNQIPQGNQFRITSNGRIIKKTHTDQIGDND